MRNIILILFLLTTKLVTAQGDAVPSSVVKAIFLFNFTKFIDWPPANFKDANAPLVIGILGDNPFGTYLEESIINEKKETHPLIVKYFKTAEEAKDCHILFINKQEPAQLKQALAAVKGRDMLTVSDAADFTKMGGTVRFFTENKKVRFEVNMETVKTANLVISSKLLRLAVIINADSQ